MNGQQLRMLLLQAMPRLAMAKEELRALDAAIGDGDLGITVSKGAEAVVAELSRNGELTTPADVLKAAARQFAAANPSTMSALVAAGILAAVKSAEAAPDIDRTAAADMLAAAIARIGKLGGAEPGDKTILDALIPSLAAAQGRSDTAQDTLGAMVAAAQAAVDETTAFQSRRGRAAWIGERSVGHPDAGAVAYVRLLEALAFAWPVADESSEPPTQPAMR